MYLLLILKGIVLGVLQFWAKYEHDEPDMNAIAVVHQAVVSDLDGEDAGTSSRVPNLVVGAPGKEDTTYDWTQVGSDFAHDSYGESTALSADGSRLAIMYGDPMVGKNQVRVYDWVGSEWTQIGSDFNCEAWIYNQLSSSVALSADGNRLAIGASGQDESGGPVRLYDWNRTHWTQVGSDLNGEAGRDIFAGLALSGNGNRLAVRVLVAYGHPGLDLGDIVVRIYDWVGIQWTQVGSDLSIVEAQSVPLWGFALSADGNRVAATTPHSANGVDAVIRIYDLTRSEWTQVGSDLSIILDMDLDGAMVALSEDGNRVATGVRNALGSVGLVRIFDWTGSQWTQLGSDLDFEYLGSKIALSADGNRLAINAATRSVDFVSRFLVHVYDWTGSQWIQVGSDLDGNGLAQSNVAMSADGSHLATSTDGDVAGWDRLSGVDAGNVRIYSFE